MSTLAQCGWSCTVTLGPQNMTEYLPLSALGYCWAILSNSLFHIGLQRNSTGTALHSIGYPVGNCMLSQADTAWTLQVSHASCTGNTHTQHPTMVCAAITPSELKEAKHESAA